MISRPILARLGSNFLTLALVRGFSVFGPLIVMPFLVRTIGIGNWGRISFALAATAFAAPVVMYGFSVSATATVARLQDQPSALQRFWHAHIATSLWIAIIVLVLGGVGIFWLEIDLAMQQLLGGALVLSVATALVPVWLFMGLERMRSLVISNAVNRLGFLSLVLIFIRGPGDTPTVLILGAVTAVAGLVLALELARREFGFAPRIRITLATGRQTLAQGYPAFLLMVVPLAYNAGAVVLLGVSTGTKEVGLFAIASTVVEVALTAGRLLASAALPLVATKESRHQALARSSLLLGVLLGAGIATVTPWLAIWLAPNDAEHVKALLWLLAASVPFVFAQLVYNQNGLAIIGAEKLASRIVIVVSLMGCLSALILVPRFGAVGVAVVVLASRAVLGLSSYLAFQKLDASGFQSTRLEVGA